MANRDVISKKIEAGTNDHVLVVIERENRPTISIDQSSDGCLSVRVDGMFMFNMGSFVERMQFKGDPESPKLPMKRFCPLCGEEIKLWSSAGHKCKYND